MENLTQGTEREPEEKKAPAPLNWAQAKRQLAEDQTARKRVVFENFGKNGEPLEFEIRQLSAQEFDLIRSKARRRALPRNRGQEEEGPQIDEHTLHVGIVKRGVTKGPEGWQGSAEDVDCLPRKIRDDLADMIDDFSSLPEETRVKFRPVGKGE